VTCGNENVRAALETAWQCRTLLGASAITLEYPVLRHASNLESVLTYEGTEEVHQLAVGKAVTGYSAFRLATTPEAPHICGNPGHCRPSPATAPPICSSYDRQGILKRANAEVRRSGWQQVRAGAGT
jgi:hypothetical protein